MGETAIDEETFNDYIQEINSIYTADKVSGAARLIGCPKELTVRNDQYHLLGKFGTTLQTLDQMANGWR